LCRRLTLDPRAPMKSGLAWGWAASFHRFASEPGAMDWALYDPAEQDAREASPSRASIRAGPGTDLGAAKTAKPAEPSRNSP